ncbi:MAG: 1-acyl-sn-glycerol-3-phosphate acyltransferase [Clostridia bacterium]|nr:1-acyl-sn-glycerol-3-phosphate acyltransferase [Clostridia bacterium]
MAIDYHKEFKNRKIKKPNMFIAHVVQFVFKQIAKKRNTEFVYTEEYLKLKNSQVIYLCQHKSSLDYIYLFAGLKNLNMHVLCGYQNVFQKNIYKLLKSLGVIAKMLYQPDMQATRQMFQGIKRGGSIIIFPEGIQSTSGSTHPINPATKNFIIKAGLPVVLVSFKGTYFSRTRYSTDVKKGKITVTFDKLFSAEDIKNLSQDEIHNKLLQKFKYNEFEEFKNEKVAFYGKKPNIYGLDNVIYKCPNCKSEYEFSTKEDVMTCGKCNFAIKMDEYYDIRSVNGNLPFSNIDEWYKWQRKVIAKEILSEDFKLSSLVKVGKINVKKLDNNYSLLYHGEGKLTLTNKGLTYEGTFEGETKKLFFEPEQVYSLTMSLQYDLDLYYKSEYFNFKLLEDEKKVAKWMIAAEEIHNLHDTTWKKVSDEVYEYEQ